MTKAKISQYDAVAGNNTDVNGVNIAEGCPPSSMNNMGREIMAALKRFQVGSDGDGVTVGGSLVVSGSTTANTFSATVFQTDTISEKTSAAGVTVDGVLLKDSEVTTDVIKEKTSATGVTIDGVLLKDSTVVAGAGTALLPSITTTGDVNTGIFFSAANTVDIATDGVAQAQINSAGDFAINAGFGSVGKAYLCRAWVNFNGTANSNLSGTYARTSPSTTVTVTATAHGLIVGSSVNLDFTTGTGLDGIYTVVTVADANTFTVTTVASTTTSGNVTLLRNTIRGSGNVSSIMDNGTGDYTVNFTTAMPDVNYSVSGMASDVGGTGNRGLVSLYTGATAPAVGSFRIFTFADSTQTNNAHIFCSVFR